MTRLIISIVTIVSVPRRGLMSFLQKAKNGGYVDWESTGFQSPEGD
jgi:hypothetical protein